MNPQLGIFGILASTTTLPDVLANAVLSLLAVIAFIAACGIISNGMRALLQSLIAAFFGSYAAYVMLARFMVPGVFVHEASHALFAFASGGKVTEFSITPDPATNTLGHINFTPRGPKPLQGVQMLLCGIAPAIVCPVLLICLVAFAIPATDIIWVRILLWYLVVCLFAHSALSMADLRSASWGFVLVSAFLFVLFLVFPIDFAALDNLLGISYVLSKL